LVTIPTTKLIETRIHRSIVPSTRASGTLKILFTLTEQITRGIKRTTARTIFAMVTEEK
jgi:hypothetical protein